MKKKNKKKTPQILSKIITFEMFCVFLYFNGKHKEIILVGLFLYNNCRFKFGEGRKKNKKNSNPEKSIKSLTVFFPVYKNKKKQSRLENISIKWIIIIKIYNCTDVALRFFNLIFYHKFAIVKHCKFVFLYNLKEFSD